MKTYKTPQKKFAGGMLKKLGPKIVDMVKSSRESVAKSAKPAAVAAAENPTVKSKAKGFLGKLAKNLRGRRPFKSGGAVMSDKAGRAMKNKTADARGRAMKGK